MAVDNDGNTVTAITSSFSVTTKGTLSSCISMYNTSLPADVLPKGCIFSVRGKIASTFNLKKVWGGVYKTDGTKTSVYYEASPNTDFYDINKSFDDNLLFNTLEAGQYIY